LEIIHTVSFNGDAIDDEYELQLFLQVLKADSLVENKVFNISSDTDAVRCFFDVQSVWNWETEKTSIEGYVTVIQRDLKKITLLFDLKITDLREQRFFSYTGKRSFVKSSIVRPKYWNAY
jgi:hypothetical protein